MDSDTINPGLLMSKASNSTTAFSTTHFSCSGFDTGDLGDTSLDNMDFRMDKSGLTHPGANDFGATDSSFIDFGFMELISFDGIAPGPGNPTRFECAPMETFPPEPNTRDPGTMLDQGTDNDLTDIDLQARIVMDGRMTHHNLTDSSNLSLILNAAGALRNLRTHWSSRNSQPSIQCESGDAAADNYTQHHESKSFPNPTWPREVYPTGSAATKIITLDDRREYRPKHLDALVLNAIITADDWEEYRPFIQQLYIIENVKLKDVMKILETKFGFIATKKMYSSKLKQWGLMKYYKAGEKEQLARVVKAHRDAGEAIPRLTLRNRPVRIDRIRRFCKQQKILEEIWSTIPSNSSSNTGIGSSSGPPTGTRRAARAVIITGARQIVQNSSLSSVPDLEKIWFHPERPFSSTSKEGRIELILWEVKTYCKSRRPFPLDSSSLGGASFQNGSDKEEIFEYANEWRDKLVFGIGAFVQQKSAKGWRLLNEACGMIHQILDQQSEALLRLLLDAFGDSNWAVYADLRSYVLQFFIKISATKLGCNHPISIVLYHLQEQQLFADAVKPAFEVLIEVSEENRDPTDDQVWHIKEYYRRTLIYREEYAAAESHCLQSLKQAKEVFGLLHWRTRSLVYDIAYVHHRQGFYNLAEAEYQDVVQRGRENLGAGFPDDDCISALRGLAWICEERGDSVQSEEYWRTSLQGVIKAWGIEDNFSVYIIGQLEESFGNQGMDPEAWLQQNFGISCI